MAALNVQEFSLLESCTTGPRALPPSSVWIAHQQPDFAEIRVAVLKALVAQKSSLIAVNESEEICDPVHFLAHLMGEMEGSVGNKCLHLLNLTVTDPDLNTAFETVLDNKKAIYLPPGWIHATITVKAGILLGRTFYEPYCALSTADCLLDDLNVATSLGRPSSTRAEDFDDIFETLRTYYSEALEVSLFESMDLTRSAAMNGWPELEDELRKACKDANMSKLKLKRTCKVIYQRIAQRKASTPPSDGTENPCPHHPGRNLNLEHFMEEHLLNFHAEVRNVPAKRKSRALKLITGCAKELKVAPEAA
ncbi:MAG: hypothetical protein Q9162_007193 [Coniocarpon cinnabarinum]